MILLKLLNVMKNFFFIPVLFKWALMISSFLIFCHLFSLLFFLILWDGVALVICLVVIVFLMV